MTTTIYHNPRCSTSRKALSLLQERGLEPTVIEYLKTPPSAGEILAIAEASGQPLRSLIRTRESEYLAQGLDNPGLSDEQIAQALHKTPVLLNRPIVVNKNGARLGRPLEAILEILDPT